MAFMSLRQSLASALLSEAAICASKLAPSTWRIHLLPSIADLLLIIYFHPCQQGSIGLLHMQTPCIHFDTGLQGLLGRGTQHTPTILLSHA